MARVVEVPTPRPADEVSPTRGLALAGLLVGIGIGGLIDGVFLHQVLQWHHMLTAYRDGTSFPSTTVGGLQDNTLADGLFHVVTLVFLLIGLFMLWRRLGAVGRPAPTRALTGLMLAGWGLFNLVEGLVDHQILGVHHVRDDVATKWPYDVGFLLFGAGLLAIGAWLYRSARPELSPSAASPGAARRRP
jgi:uncharacterized membrane protein